MVVTGTKGNPLVLLAEQLNEPLHQLESSCPLYDWKTGEKVPEDVDTRIEAHFNEILTKAAKFPPDRFSSLGKAIEHLLSELSLTPLERSLFDWHIANLEYACATELTPVSLHHWDQDDENELKGPHCLLPNGYGAIARALADKLDVRYNSPVTTVKVTPNGVAVLVKNTASVVEPSSPPLLRGNYCICTLPLGVLKKNIVKFDPPLPPGKVEAIQSLGFGVLNKLLLCFETCFWPNEGDYFGVTADKSSLRGENFLFWNMQRCMGRPVLVALIAGNSAVQCEQENGTFVLLSV